MMALEPVQLDDLTWEGMLESARRRIPSASNGRWTLHAPVDPGITLLELQAWLLEQRVFMVDQTPNDMVGAILALLDLPPEPTGVASTVLTAAAPTARVVPKGAIAQVYGHTPRLV